jgi:hypothetical protein
VICGSIARSFGSNMRVGQLSMMAGAMLIDVESDCVAKMTRRSFAQGLQPFAQCPAKSSSSREPAFIDDQG